jgi:hypothetical protein
MRSIDYYDGWNDALDKVYRELFHADRKQAMWILGFRVSWPRIEADERLAQIAASRQSHRR